MKLARFLREESSLHRFKFATPRSSAVIAGGVERPRHSLALTLEPSSLTPVEGDLLMIDLTAYQVGASRTS